MDSCVEVLNARNRIEIPVSQSEHERMNRVLSLLPDNAKSILEIGARHGVMTERLAERCQDVTALDLQKPSFQIEHVTPVQGDVQHLQFPDNSFECVVCTEVLEHLPDVSAGAKEIVRVAKSYILLGVPFRQDRRVGRMTCVHCGRINPPYGHLNSFDEKELERLFAGTTLCAIEYVSTNRERTNSLSVWLQDIARNPYGAYDQEEPCIHCNQKMQRPPQNSLFRRLAGVLGTRLYEMQFALNQPRATWIIALFEKAPAVYGATQYDRSFSTSTVYIIETIHGQQGKITINRYPTLFHPEEAMTERTIRIIADKNKPFEKYDADYVFYHVEGYENAQRWRILRQTKAGRLPKAIREASVDFLASRQFLNEMDLSKQTA